MLQFFVNRLLIALLVAVTVTAIGFGLLRISGDLAAELAGDDATEEEIAQVALFLAAQAPRDMTGQFIDVFGSP